ncbi:MAG: peptidase U32 family protein [Candidatus Brocadiales bacterium]
MKLSQTRLELLAPAGKWDVLEAVVEAGADAVYLGGKRFNMRLHRKDFNLTQDELAQAAEFTHGKGRKLYVTVNSLLSERELEGLGDYLRFLYSIGVDAIIVQDLAVISLVRELGLDLPMHASTMMNVHNVDMAEELVRLGISRIITSRDITLAQVKEIREKALVEVEYFVHGDMCSVQSGLCYSSGVLFGKSANRGECMKPCRWDYTLLGGSNGEKLGELDSGHFLAIKDMCLLGHIPELISAGVSSFKIEGRMRTAEFLKDIVGIYRRAIDAYLSSPFTYYLDVKEFERLYSDRVRELSTCSAFSTSTVNTFDYTGRREPLFFSRAAREERLSPDDVSKSPFDGDLFSTNGHVGAEKKLAVKVGSLTAVERALEAGADYIYISGEISPLRGQGWTKAMLEEASYQVRSAGKKIVAGTPRITTGREMQEVEWLLETTKVLGFDATLVHNLGTLKIARELNLPIISDYSFNVINSCSARLLSDLGADRVTTSMEASLSDIHCLTQDYSTNQAEVECVVHGPVVGMTLEHCLPALILTGGSGKDVCRLPCRYISYALKDEYGEIRPVEVDQHCRNHILLATDLCMLPYLTHFVNTGVTVFRIEAQYYSDGVVGKAVETYRKHLDFLSKNPCEKDPMLGLYLEELLKISPRGLGLGAYAKDVTDSQSTLEVMRSLSYAH